MWWFFQAIFRVFDKYVQNRLQEAVTNFLRQRYGCRISLQEYGDKERVQHLFHKRWFISEHNAEVTTYDKDK